ncbi:uncharacterized protein LOC136083034 [Hydra vulgaris]|uniref:Uncharacterized protein LOC136083034 n=1 Tax=Hydra vulgaris TaxID=6087 RepID=A0ABM4CA29_HYDVU
MNEFREISKNQLDKIVIDLKDEKSMCEDMNSRFCTRYVNINLFANDTLVCIEGNNYEESMMKLYLDLEVVATWFSGNGLKLNANASINDIKILQKLQNKAMRTILKCDWFTHSKDMLIRLDWLSVKENIQVKVLTFIRNTIQLQKMDAFQEFCKISSEMHNYCTRNAAKYHLKIQNKKSGQKSILCNGIKLCNKLPNESKLLGKKAFKKICCQHKRTVAKFNYENFYIKIGKKNEKDEETLKSTLNVRSGPLGYAKLHDAVFSKNPNKIRQLLEYGADVNLMSDGGYTPLHIAASIDACSCIEVLLEYNARTTIRDENQRTPHDTAVYYDSVNSARLLLSHDSITSLGFEHLINKFEFVTILKSLGTDSYINSINSEAFSNDSLNH